jgi:hypothetical protein
VNMALKLMLMDVTFVNVKNLVSTLYNNK